MRLMLCRKAFYCYFCAMDNIATGVFVQGATLEEIERMVCRAVDRRMAAFVAFLRQEPPVLVRRKDAAAMLGISLPTLDAYGRVGILHPKHIGGRVFYSEDELSAVKSGRPLREHLPVPKQ